MADYSVEIQPSAQKELKWLASSVVERILARIVALGANARPPGCKKLAGGERDWRIRVGEYRVVYTINDAKRLVSIRRIRRRSDVYKP